MLSKPFYLISTIGGSVVSFGLAIIAGVQAVAQEMQPWEASGELWMLAPTVGLHANAVNRISEVPRPESRGMVF